MSAELAPENKQKSEGPASTSASAAPVCLTLHDFQLGNPSRGLVINEGLYSAIKLMSGYHVWATNRLLASVSELSDEEYHRNLGLFANSIHGIIVHLVEAERVWVNRLTSKKIPTPSLGNDYLWEDGQPTDVWEKFIPTRQSACKAIADGAAVLQKFVSERTDSDIGAPLEYTNRKAVHFHTCVSAVLLHVFNHGTHHRGQISAALMLLKRPYPVLDYLYYLAPK